MCGEIRLAVEHLIERGNQAAHIARFWNKAKRAVTFHLRYHARFFTSGNDYYR
ncbi:Uncharacterised protein [Vibrio cholerae]|nr:Uncharacterised protein [Vibrio cholerae]CSD13524.1 Uncharacterised protein [Vibrio cholerae]